MAQPLIASYQLPLRDIRIHVDQKKGKCCASKKTDNNRRSKGKSCQCNSFASCCRLNYIPVADFIFSVLVIKTAPGNAIFGGSKIEQGYMVASWHPPELTGS
jgi:hypothetical protein